MDYAIKKAVSVLNKGGIIIFPTDTAYGIGCRVDKKEAIQRLFDLRKRDKSKATPVLVSSIEMVEGYLRALPDSVLNLMKKYWPGGLTVVFPCQINKVEKLVRGGGKTLGVRMPNNKIALKMIEEAGVPILGTSANFAGEQTPYSYDEINPDLIKKVDYVLIGKTKTQQSSTVIDCSVRPWKILREGAVKIEV